MIEDFTTSNNSPFPKRQLADKLRKHALDASNALSAIQSVSQLYPYLLNGYQPNLSHTLNQSEIFANAHDLLLTATSEFLDRCLRKLEPNELLALANDPQDPLHERVMDELNTRDHNSHLTQA